MVRVLTVTDVCQLVQRVGMQEFLQRLLDYLEQDFQQWQDFQKSPRHAVHFDHGVMELMPIAGKNYYAYKFVNGHPGNPALNKLTVVATGMLAEIDSGYPLLISEMTLLTAFRTAITAALAAKHLARPDSKTIGIIGTGSQGEFQVLAHQVACGTQRVQYYDIDPKAMQKFAANLASYNLELIPCDDIQSTLKNADIVITATADKNRLQILKDDWIEEGMHINGVGGDCPGKTELDAKILMRSKIVVEYLPQTQIEGEIQGLEQADIYAELWELVQGKKLGRQGDKEITLFDSVGFAIEDHAILKLIHDLAEIHDAGSKLELIPNLKDPKNLFQLLLR